MTRIIDRIGFLEKIKRGFKVNPVCALLGPRQCGKTTLAKHYSEKATSKIHFFDLEDPIDLARLDAPKISLEQLEGLIIIDEIQRRPELFPVIRVLVDQNKDRKFLILGSASQELIRQSSESLAGRITQIEITPFNLKEVNNLKSLWLKGGFPKSFLNEEPISFDWRKTYIQTFIEKDIPNLGFKSPSQIIWRFWNMLTFYHGQKFNASDIGASLDINYKTVQHYLDILEGTFMVRTLEPWYENIGKRQTKTKKIYFRDSGLLHVFLNISSLDELNLHPKLGASWEGFALEEIIRSMEVNKNDCYYWELKNKAELDLLILKNGKKIGFEFKYSDSPKITKSMIIALENLKLYELNIIIPLNIQAPYYIHEKIKVNSLESYLNQAN